jgi:NAD(P)H dehydrogenase (quinone)
MPKLLVLFQSRSPDVTALAEAVVEGARSVRFAEVDLRRLAVSDEDPHLPDTSGRSHRALERVEEIAAYDGLVLALSGDGDRGTTLTNAFESLGGSLVNKVGAAVTTAEGAGRSAVLWSALTPMADRGMILVPMPFAEPTEAASARRLGKRVAEVIGWVTHARSHHHHDHHHGDQHTHDHH